MVPFPVGILLSFFLFLYYSEINKFITTAITFAHLTLASIWKKIWEALWNSETKTWFHFLLVFCFHSFCFSIIPRSTKLLQRQWNFCAFDASLDLKKDLRSLWNSEPKTWFHFLLVFCCHSFCFSIIPRNKKNDNRIPTGNGTMF